MTRFPDPKPSDDANEQNDAGLRALAARYVDLWQENWTAWLGPPQDDEDDKPAGSR